MLEPIEMQFVELGIHVTSFQVSDGDLAQVMLLVVHHRNDLLH